MPGTETLSLANETGAVTTRLIFFFITLSPLLLMQTRFVQNKRYLVTGKYKVHSCKKHKYALINIIAILNLSHGISLKNFTGNVGT